jgi:flagellin-like protein
MKKGVSTIIATVLLIALTLTAASVVWAVVKNIVESNQKTAQACFNNFDKLSINSRYTCYDSTNDEFQFSIDRGDIDLEKIIVAVTGETSEGEITTSRFELTSTPTSFATLGKYPNPSYESDLLTLPAKNAGKTYITDAFKDKAPDVIIIAAVIDGKQCDAADTLTTIDDCSLLA